METSTLKTILVLLFVAFVSTLVQSVEFTLCGPVIPNGTKIENVTLTATKCNPICEVNRTGKLVLQATLTSPKLSVPLLALKAQLADASAKPQVSQPNSTFLANGLNITAIGKDTFRVAIEVNLNVSKAQNNTGRIQWNLIKDNEVAICIETPVIFKN